MLYFIPVAMVAWHLAPGATLAMSAISDFSWFLMDRFYEPHSKHELLWYFNAFVCFVSFAALGSVVNDLRRRLFQLANAPEEAKKFTEEIRHLRNQFQVVCAWTKQITVDDEGIPLDTFLITELDIKFTHGIPLKAFGAGDDDHEMINICLDREWAVKMV
jgi:hypothetical protein